jgi:hypothetical protein
LVAQYEEERTIGKSGGGASLYLSKKAKEYLSPGDKVKVAVAIVDNEIKMTVSKPLYNFNIEEIRRIARDDFETEYDKELGEVRVFNAVRDNLSLSYSQSLSEKTAPGYVTIKISFPNPKPDEIDQIEKLARRLRNKFDVVVRPEGDLDAVNVLKDPDRYHLDNRRKVIELLNAKKKPFSLSVSFRFNNKHNTIGDIETALKAALQLKSEVSPLEA